MEEVIGLAHRVYDVSDGEVVADLRGALVTEHNLVQSFFAESAPQFVPAGSPS